MNKEIKEKVDKIFVELKKKVGDVINSSTKKKVGRPKIDKSYFLLNYKTTEEKWGCGEFDKSSKGNMLLRVNEILNYDNIDYVKIELIRK
jgi:hypothetical protein